MKAVDLSIDYTLAHNNDIAAVKPNMFSILNVVKLSIDFNDEPIDSEAVKPNEVLMLRTRMIFKSCMGGKL